MSAWKLEAAKARLSEVVRQAAEHGPQTITVRGREAAVLVSADDYRRLAGGPTGESWVTRFRQGFIGDIDLERDDDRGRDFEL
jgi:antitoxin Phd